MIFGTPPKVSQRNNMLTDGSVDTPGIINKERLETMVETFLDEEKFFEEWEKTGRGR